MPSYSSLSFYSYSELPPPPPPLTVTNHPRWDLFDSTLLQKRRLKPFSVASGQDFVSSHSPAKNFSRDDLTGKEGYGYGNGRQYCGYSGTIHCYSDPCYYLLGGMPTEELPQYLKKTYTGWDNIVGKISTSGFFWYVFYLIFTSRATHPLRIDRMQRTSKFLLKSSNNNHPKKFNYQPHFPLIKYQASIHERWPQC